MSDALVSLITLSTTVSLMLLLSTLNLLGVALFLKFSVSLDRVSLLFTRPLPYSSSVLYKYNFVSVSKFIKNS